ncbi:hypothetical protein Syun_016811 [Stephania yunnanensis]|uniref:beta-ketoacyl-[acyl-carrier-protein] synthase I n=1 Tax=Stephania yunnanensis TaxID=152371 RepID=A0AAP0J5X4_9MAGN
MNNSLRRVDNVSWMFHKAGKFTVSKAYGRLTEARNATSEGDSYYRQRQFAFPHLTHLTLSIFIASPRPPPSQTTTPDDHPRRPPPPQTTTIFITVIVDGDSSTATRRRLVVVRSYLLLLVVATVLREDVNYINAHATSTQAGDIKGSQSSSLSGVAIRVFFVGLCDHPMFSFRTKKPIQLKVNSTKSMIGHLLGAAGAVEAVATVQKRTVAKCSTRGGTRRNSSRGRGRSQGNEGQGEGQSTGLGRGGQARRGGRRPINVVSYPNRGEDFIDLNEPVVESQNYNAERLSLDRELRGLPSKLSGHTQRSGEKDNVNTQEVLSSTSFRLPYVEKIPPYTSWIFLEKVVKINLWLGGDRYAMTNMVVRRLSRSDSEEEIAEPREEKHEFSKVKTIVMVREDLSVVCVLSAAS